MTATITCKLLETIYGDEALSCTRFHWMKWRQNGQWSAKKVCLQN